MKVRHRGSKRRRDPNCLSRGAAQDDLSGGLANKRPNWTAVTALATVALAVITGLSLAVTLIASSIGQATSGSNASADPGHEQLVLRASTIVVQESTLTIEQGAHRRRRITSVRIRRESTVLRLTTFHGLMGWPQLDAAVGNLSHTYGGVPMTRLTPSHSGPLGLESRPTTATAELRVSGGPARLAHIAPPPVRRASSLTLLHGLGAGLRRQVALVQCAQPL
jgi:hypothetical protein